MKPEKPRDLNALLQEMLALQRLLPGQPAPPSSRLPSPRP
jgi:hypothetical protein